MRTYTDGEVGNLRQDEQKVGTARPRDTRILGPEKNRAAQNRTS